MNQNLTDINIVLDRSGSMSSIRVDTIGGFNTFLKAQKEVPGEATLTLAQFDDQYELIHNGKNIQDVPELTKATFIPRGWTALLDAIGSTIIATGARISALPEENRPGKVLFVILTDGEENKSSEFTREKINEMIKHQADVYQWEFVFIGAKQDAIKTGAGFGIKAGNAMSYAANAIGTQSVFNSVSDNAAEYRCAKLTNQSFFSQEDRDMQKKAGAVNA
jgi:hypothetical protein